MIIFQCNLRFSLISWPLIKRPRVEPRSNLFGPSHDRNHSRTSTGTYSWNQHSFFLIYNKHLKLRYMEQIIPLVKTLVNMNTQTFTMMRHSITYFCIVPHLTMIFIALSRNDDNGIIIFWEMKWSSTLTTCLCILCRHKACFIMTTMIICVRNVPSNFLWIEHHIQKGKHHSSCKLHHLTYYCGIN